MDEKELFRLFANVKNGDRKSFDLLYHRTWRPLFDLALAKTRDEDEAKDILQEIYAKVWDKREGMEIQLNVGAYLYRMTKHEIIRRMQSAVQLHEKKNIYKDAVDELSATLEENLLAKELRQQWETEIAKLPSKQREIYMLHYQLEYSITEIALELGIAEQTVKNQLVSAKKKIRTVMEAGLCLYLLSLLG